MEVLVVNLYEDDNERVTNPAIAKERAEELLKGKAGKEIYVNVGDYFLLSYLDLLGEGKVRFKFNGIERTGLVG